MWVKATPLPAHLPPAPWSNRLFRGGKIHASGQVSAPARQYVALDRLDHLVDDALLAIPSFSIVTDLPNLFSSTNGIYVNPRGDGISWERPASIELIHPDGTEGFQINGGIRIRLRSTFTAAAQAVPRKMIDCLPVISRNTVG